MHIRFVSLAALLPALGLGCGNDPLHPTRTIEHRGTATIASINGNDGDDGSDGNNGSASGGSRGSGGSSSGSIGASGDGCFAPAAFDFPEDAEACHGDQLTKFDAAIGLTVGVVLCGDSEERLRIYLSDDNQSFFPATDDAGNGQDQCELVNPQFTIGNEDGITSGNCSNCSDSINLPLEGVPVWVRGFFGDPFSFDPHSPVWSDQVSQLSCGFNVVTCEEDLGG